MTFFLFLQDASLRLLQDSDFSFFLFFFLFFKGISGVNSGILISGVREEVFFFFLFSYLGGHELPYLPSHFFLIIITKAKLLQGWSLICLFLNLNLNVNLGVELNLHLGNLTKAPLVDIGIVDTSSIYVI